jgi:hypothetical protein
MGVGYVDQSRMVGCEIDIVSEVKCTISVFKVNTWAAIEFGNIIYNYTNILPIVINMQFNFLV